MFTRQTVVLECAASRTALATFTCRRGGRLRLAGCAVEHLPLSATGGEQWLEHTRAALANLRGKLKSSAPVVLVLPGHLTLLKLIRTPRVEPGKREKVIRFEAEQSIPYTLNEVVWDSVVAGEHAAGVDVLLAAAKLEAIESLCAAVQAACFEPALILPSSLATLAAFRLVHAGSQEPTLVLNLGARSTTLVQVEGSGFVARTLALGGQSITRQLVEAQPCEWAEAEAIKLAGASKLSSGNGSLAAAALEVFATRLTQEITRSALYYRRLNGMANPTRICLTGDGARLAGLENALADKLRIPVERLDLSPAVETAGDVFSNNTGGPAPMLTDLVGAAASQLRPGQPVLNLLPSRWRRQADLRRRQVWLAGAAALAMAAGLPPLLHYRAIAAEARQKADAIERVLTPLREREARNRTNLRQLEELKQQIVRLQHVHARRTGWLGLFADLQERLGRVEDVWLDRLAVASAPGAPLRLAISGRMLDRANPLSPVSFETFHRVQALLASIVDSPFVASVEGERFDTAQPGILKFEVVLVADPARPL